MEIELKLLAAPDVLAQLRRHEAVKALQQGRARTLVLHTLYYDTPQRELARAGIALRVRRAGKHWIQSLKAGGGAAAGLHERVEIEWPLVDATLDPKCLATTPYAEFFDAERVKALRPAFETEIQRVVIQLCFKDGTRAELALDEGVVRAGSRTAPLCEAEIELKEGQSTRLFELASQLVPDLPLRVGHVSKAQRGDLLARNASSQPQKARSVVLDPNLPAIEALRRILLGCVAQMQANEEGLLGSEDPEFLHQFRVGLRRLRACLGMFGELGQSEELSKLKAECKWLAQELNAARDWDVLCLETLPELQKIAASDSRVAGLAARCADIRVRHRQAARDAVGSPRYVRALLQLGLFCAQPACGLGADARAETSLKDWVPRILERRDRRLRKSGDKVPKLSPVERHQVRIRAKKLRYAADFVAPLYTDSKAYLEALERLQSVLGMVNDASVAESLVAPLATELPMPCGMLYGWNAMRVDEALRRYPKYWRKFKNASKFWNVDA